MPSDGTNVSPEKTNYMMTNPVTDRSLGTARGAEERKEINVHDDSAISEEKRFIKKIYIENNRLV